MLDIKHIMYMKDIGLRLFNYAYIFNDTLANEHNQLCN